eukprot:TRINITY_DN47496_c0_g1_i1.p1 TRINITY_DN47496_c0_g1~~TRINITY_DN47496_c0_g1_i1.p1  ORF type:complete len:632 (-),score=147.31 TRINITY_DN47496_c0_g1_i1:6-1901(-)
MAKNDDISEASRELVDLSAEAVGSLGVHLAQLGQLINASEVVPPKGKRSVAIRMKEKLETYKAYTVDVAQRRKDIEDKMRDDFERLQAWRKNAGTEGASLVEELEALYGKVRAQEKEIIRKQQQIEAEQEMVRQLQETIARKDRKWQSLADDYCKRLVSSSSEISQRAATNSWLQCAFDEIRFKWKANEEKEKLRIQHHQRMRKARAQARIDTIRREQGKRVLQSCFYAFQEEQVERRAERLMAELRRRFSDEMLVMNAQLSQALGDEEKAKELVAEQVRRMEEARRAQAEAERLAKLAQRDAREARQERDKALKERDKALEAKKQAEDERDHALREKASAEAHAAECEGRAEVAEQARMKAELRQRKAEELVKKKQKKILSLQRMLAEIGAESDSDAPPDERAPAFFVNEDGTKVPRPRTRKERMGMAYREAETSRYELRIGMAAMLDKDTMNLEAMNRLREEMTAVLMELRTVRLSNEKLIIENKQATDRAIKAEAGMQEARKRAVAAEDNAAKAAWNTASTAFPSRPSTSPPEIEDLTVQPLNPGPLAPSSAGVPSFSPTKPNFYPADGEGRSPRLLMKTKSTPIIMPSLHGLGASSPTGEMSPGRLTSLAPLRKLRKPAPDWRISWH